MIGDQQACTDLTDSVAVVAGDTLAWGMSTTVGNSGHRINIAAYCQ